MSTTRDPKGDEMAGTRRNRALLTALITALALVSTGTAFAAGLTLTKAEKFITSHRNSVLARFHRDSSHLNGTNITSCKHKGSNAVQCEFTAGYDTGASCTQTVKVKRISPGHLKLRFVGPAACAA
jgi:hypothetical protein